MAEDTPSLLDRARAAAGTKTSNCTIAKLLTSHPDIGLDELIANAGTGNGEAIPYSVAAAVITDAVGMKVEGQTVSRHNRRRCSCS